MTLKSTKPKPDVLRAERAVATLAAAYPGVTEDRPWGHRAFKVNKKTFLFLGSDHTGLGLSVKLPESGVMALEFPFTEPTHYGLGKSGWVTAHFETGRAVPLPLIREWLDESYRAIAPKKLAAAMAPKKLSVASAGKVAKRPAAVRRKVPPRAKRPKPR